MELVPFSRSGVWRNNAPLFAKPTLDSSRSQYSAPPQDVVYSHSFEAVCQDSSSSNLISHTYGCNFQGLILRSEHSNSTTSQNRESSVSRLPRFIQESLSWNALGRSMSGKTCKSTIARLLSSSRANRVMNLRSCRTGSTIQRRVVL